MVQGRFKTLGVGFGSNGRREDVITIEEAWGGLVLNLPIPDVCQNCFVLSV
jgi:hypothetical protein